MKYGFRFVTREEWGLLRGLFRSAFWFKIVGSAIAGVALLIFAVFVPARMTRRSIVASLIPLGQSLEGLAGSALYLRNRYDIRAVFLTWSMALRLVGVAIGAQYGLVEAIAGVLIAQVDRDRLGRRRRSAGVPPLPAGGGRASRGASGGDRHLHRPVERGDRRALAARRPRAAAARRRDDDDADRHLQDRAGAAVRASRRCRRRRGWCCSPSRRASGSAAAQSAVLGQVRRYSLVAALCCRRSPCRRCSG